MTKSQRLSIAAPTRQRIPHGAISADVSRSGAAGIATVDVENRETSPDTRRAKPGRPPKNADEKARQVSVTLFPRELEGLDGLVEAVHGHYNLPPNMIVRSQVARLAVLRLMELTPEEIWDELKRLKP